MKLPILVLMAMGTACCAGRSPVIKNLRQFESSEFFRRLDLRMSGTIDNELGQTAGVDYMDRRSWYEARFAGRYLQTRPNYMIFVSFEVPGKMGNPYDNFRDDRGIESLMLEADKQDNQDTRPEERRYAFKLFLEMNRISKGQQEVILKHLDVADRFRKRTDGNATTDYYSLTDDKLVNGLKYRVWGSHSAVQLTLEFQ